MILGDGDRFTCEACGGTFTKAWSDEEAEAEARRFFTDEEIADGALVCRSCWLKIMAENGADVE